MEDQDAVTTERSAASRVARLLCGFAFLVVVVVAAAAPREAAAMTADGALITNTASATMYWGQGGGSNFPAGYGGLMGGSQQFTMSYNATTNVLVSCPIVGVQKWADLSTQASGANVTFTICLVNNSLLASAWAVTLTDRIPDNMATLAPPISSIWNPTGSVVTNSYSADNIAYSLTGPVAAGQVAPYWLRWTFSSIAPGRSACVYFALRVL